MKTIQVIVIMLSIIFFGCKKETKIETLKKSTDTELVNVKSYFSIADIKHEFNIIVNENTNSIAIDGYIEVDTTGFVVNEVKAFRRNNMNELYIHFSHPKEYTTEEGNMDEKLKVEKQLLLDSSHWEYATTANLILWNNDSSLSTIPSSFEILNYTKEQLDSIYIEIPEPKEIGNGTIPNVIWIKRN